MPFQQSCSIYRNNSTPQNASSLIYAFLLSSIAFQSASTITYTRLIVLIPSLSFAGSQLVKKDKDGSVVKAYVDRDGIQYKHTHLDIGMGFGHNATSNSTPHHASASIDNHNTSVEPQSSAFKSVRSVDAMEARDAQRGVAHAPLKDVKQSKASGKLGGFFSRLASFRFSLRKGAEEKAKLKKKKNSSATGVGNAPGELYRMSGRYRLLLLLFMFFLRHCM